MAAEAVVSVGSVGAVGVVGVVGVVEEHEQVSSGVLQKIVPLEGQGLLLHAFSLSHKSSQ